MIWVYVTVRLCGMRLICLWVITTIESIPGVLVTFLSPWARFPNSFPRSRARTVLVIGSVMSFLYFVMDLPLTG
jgi:hypothetical protein